MSKPVIILTTGFLLLQTCFSPAFASPPTPADPERQAPNFASEFALDSFEIHAQKSDGSQIIIGTGEPDHHIQKLIDEGYTPKIIVPADEGAAVNAFKSKYGQRVNIQTLDYTPLHEELGLYQKASSPAPKRVLPSSKEVFYAITLGVIQGSIGAFVWYFAGSQNIHAAMLLGFVTIAERVAYLALRHPLDSLKRLFDVKLAKKFKNVAPWFITSTTWKLFIDVCIGMFLVHAPRLFLGIYDGTGYALGTSYVFGKLLFQSFLHSLADPFGIARVLNEGKGTISRKTANMLTYIKSSFNSSLTLLRLGNMYDFPATIFSYFLAITGIAALLVDWQYVFYIFRGGRVVVGPDMRIKRVPLNAPIKFAVVPPRENPKSSIHIQNAFLGGYRYSEVFENGRTEGTLEFDGRKLEVDLEAMEVKKINADGTGVFIREPHKKLEFLEAMRHKPAEEAPAYRIEERLGPSHYRMSLDQDGARYEITMNFIRAFDAMPDGQASPSRGLSNIELDLLDALFDLEDFRLSATTMLKRINPLTGETRHSAEVTVGKMTLAQRSNGVLVIKNGGLYVVSMKGKLSQWINKFFHANYDAGNIIKVITHHHPSLRVRIKNVLTAIRKKSHHTKMFQKPPDINCL